MTVSLDFINVWHKYIQYLHSWHSVLWKREMVWLHSNYRQEVGWQRPKLRSSGHAFRGRRLCTEQRAYSTRAQTWTPWNTRALPFLWAVTEGRAPRLPFWIYLIPTHLTYLPFLDSSAGLQLEAQDSMECEKWKSPGQREVFKGRTADMERRQKTSLNNWSTSCLRCVCN